MKKNKRNIRFRIAPTKPQPYSFDASLDTFARAQMKAQRYLNPLIISQPMSPNEAAIMIAMYADAIMSGNANNDKHKMTQDDIITATNLLIKLWKMGKFVPSPDYPYTLEQTLDYVEDED